MTNENLFAALRAAFPEDLDQPAVETDNGLTYSWRDIDRGTAMMANLLGSLQLPAGSRIAVQVEKSVEAVMQSAPFASTDTLVALSFGSVISSRPVLVAAGRQETAPAVSDSVPPLPDKTVRVQT